MTDRYAVFGNPLGHSKSPLIHARFAAECGEDLTYEKIEAAEGGFAGALARFIDEGGKGCNVTAPFKLEAFGLATDHTEASRCAGATNTLRFESGRILAENTDGAGLLRDIEVNLGLGIGGRRVLMLGAGGAARGAILPFLQAEPEELALLNRTVSKAERLCEDMKGFGDIHVIAPAEAKGFDIVINATSASLSGDCPALPETVFQHCQLAYELAYGKGLTPFLKRARDCGVSQLADGVGMLVEQAAIAFEFWRGKRPTTGGLIEELTVGEDVRRDI